MYYFSSWMRRGLGGCERLFWSGSLDRLFGMRDKGYRRLTGSDFEGLSVQFWLGVMGGIGVGESGVG
jgi:hypothetical protein